MKTRNSFVSNSSSSSFVVGFPRKPTSPEDCLQIMFNGVDEKFTTEYCGESTTSAIASQVFEDIHEEYKNEDGLPSSLDEEAINELSDLYYFTDFTYIEYEEDKRIEKTGFVYSRDQFWGQDKKLLKKLKLLHTELESMSSCDLIEEAVGKSPPYATKEGNKLIGYYENSKYIQKDLGPYPEAEIVAYEEYQKKLNKFCKSEPYLIYLDKRRSLWNQITETERQLAAMDWKAIQEAYPGHFFFVVRYADEDNQALMEHGHIFRNCPFHVRISHH